jgi:diketogulonate reductase-like aldo/keto reductase
MEAIQQSGGTKLLGSSNVSAEQLFALVAIAVVAPAFVQNRCYAQRGWDEEVRRVCDDHGIVYQGFSLLTANRDVVKSNALTSIAKHHAATSEQIIFAFALQIERVGDPINARGSTTARR